MGSSVRLDCHCPRTYYRYPVNDLNNFECALCTPNDYCFNNSLFNCSDPLMESDAGSGFFKNCTCVDRYYNDGEVCTECSVNHFCVNGQEHACPEHEWTNYLPRQAECVCQQGFYREGGICRMCPPNFYCDGTDDSKAVCPDHTVATNYTPSLSHCLCDKGYGAVHGGNVSEPHTCVRCIDSLEASEHTYKDTIGNTECLPCTECHPSSNVFTNVICNATGNAHCDTCTVCFDPTVDLTKWNLHECQELYDTVCANCSMCNYEVEWQKQACQEVSDTVCDRRRRNHLGVGGKKDRGTRSRGPSGRVHNHGLWGDGGHCSEAIEGGRAEGEKAPAHAWERESLFAFTRTEL